MRPGSWNPSGHSLGTVYVLSVACLWFSLMLFSALLQLLVPWSPSGETLGCFNLWWKEVSAASLPVCPQWHWTDLRISHVPLICPFRKEETKWITFWRWSFKFYNQVLGKCEMGIREAQRAPGLASASPLPLHLCIHLWICSFSNKAHRGRIEKVACESQDVKRYLLWKSFPGNAVVPV